MAINETKNGKERYECKQRDEIIKQKKMVKKETNGNERYECKQRDEISKQKIEEFVKFQRKRQMAMKDVNAIKGMENKSTIQ